MMAVALQYCGLPATSALMLEQPIQCLPASVWDPLCCACWLTVTVVSGNYTYIVLFNYWKFNNEKLNLSLICSPPVNPPIILKFTAQTLYCLNVFHLATCHWPYYMWKLHYKWLIFVKKPDELMGSFTFRLAFVPYVQDRHASSTVSGL